MTQMKMKVEMGVTQAFRTKHHTGFMEGCPYDALDNRARK